MSFARPTLFLFIPFFMRNLNITATLAQSATLATPNGSEIPENQKIVFQYGDDIYTINNAEKVFLELFSWYGEPSELRKNLTKFLCLLIGEKNFGTYQPEVNVLAAFQNFLDTIEDNLVIDFEKERKIVALENSYINVLKEKSNLQDEHILLLAQKRDLQSQLNKSKKKKS